MSVVHAGGCLNVICTRRHGHEESVMIQGDSKEIAQVKVGGSCVFEPFVKVMASENIDLFHCHRLARY